MFNRLLLTGSAVATLALIAACGDPAPTPVAQAPSTDSPSTPASLTAAPVTSRITLDSQRFVDPPPTAAAPSIDLSSVLKDLGTDSTTMFGDDIANSKQVETVLGLYHDVANDPKDSKGTLAYLISITGATCVASSTPPLPKSGPPITEDIVGIDTNSPCNIKIIVSANTGQPIASIEGGS